MLNLGPSKTLCFNFQRGDVWRVRGSFSWDSENAPWQRGMGSPWKPTFFWLETEQSEQSEQLQVVSSGLSARQSSRDCCIDLSWFVKVGVNSFKNPDSSSYKIDPNHTRCQKISIKNYQQKRRMNLERIFFKTPHLTACPTILIHGTGRWVAAHHAHHSLPWFVAFWVPWDFPLACGASVSQTVKLTKGAFLPRGPGDDMPRARKRINVFLCMHIMHIVYGVYVFISMLGSKTTQSFPFVSNPTRPARPKLNPHNMMWCYNRDAAIASYVQVCTGLHTCINYHIFSVIISNHVALF